MFCVADHFEPGWNEPAYSTEVGRIKRWVEGYPAAAGEFADSDGKFPQHTFFYPEEEYRPEHLDKLSELCRKGFGEIEVHLHHHHDTADGMREKLKRCKDRFSKHGALSFDCKTKETKFGFVHGNWALNNSRGDSRWCGVNSELKLLNDLGCYADFTLPSAPDRSQTGKINSIYYAKDDPARPKSHDTGTDVEAGKEPSGDLMIIQGPLTLNWRRRKWKVLPRIENGEISAHNPPTKTRIDYWIDAKIHVKGRPEWIFVKVYTHGAQEANSDIFLGESIRKMHSYLKEKYNDGKKYMLHYVTAREIYNIIKAAEGGLNGNPAMYRDYLLKRRC
ncbi:MAG: hypothetical protein WC515_00970 [Candidatus Omnitrophota bacterium]